MLIATWLLHTNRHGMAFLAMQARAIAREYQVARLQLVRSSNEEIAQRKASAQQFYRISPAEDESRFLHRGIARRAFERRFSLADHIKVVGASLDNGMLHVDLIHEVPEEAKPRKIEILRGQPQSAPQQAEQKQAA